MAWIYQYTGFNNPTNVWNKVVVADRLLSPLNPTLPAKKKKKNNRRSTFSKTRHTSSLLAHIHGLRQRKTLAKGTQTAFSPGLGCRIIRIVPGPSALETIM